MGVFEILETLQLGLVFSLVVLGVYLSFRVLNFPDLTVDGTFPLGGAVLAIAVLSGYGPWLGLLAATVAGFAAGCLTAWLNVRWKILHLLAGILTMTALYSINLRIMGQPNLSLFGQESLFSGIESLGLDVSYVMPIIMLLIAIVVVATLYLFLKTEIGLSLRATGANPRMASAQGVNKGAYVILGLGLSNALVALGGALFVEVNRFADVGLGLGKIIEGLAAVIIGEALISTRKIHWALIACVVGSIFYRFAVAFALKGDVFGLRSSDLNLITAIIVALAMMLPLMRTNLRNFFFKKGAGK